MKQARGWAARVRRGTPKEPNYGNLLDIAMDIATSIKDACWTTADGRPNLRNPTLHMAFAVASLEEWKKENVLTLTYRGKK